MVLPESILINSYLFAIRMGLGDYFNAKIVMTHQQQTHSKTEPSSTRMTSLAIGLEKINNLLRLSGRTGTKSHYEDKNKYLIFP